uniref:Uncharacterized protein n=1 Tax=Anguilla anguilla TaxID=7936 RepID=A0A0E9VX02_ANGAN
MEQGQRQHCQSDRISTFFQQ